MEERATSTYLTSPHLNKYLNQGFRKVKDYENFCLFEKVEKGKVLYRECFHKFDLYGAEWTNAPHVARKNGWRKGVPKNR